LVSTSIFRVYLFMTFNWEYFAEWSSRALSFIMRKTGLCTCIVNSKT
jgi:hypothetical protein